MPAPSITLVQYPGLTRKTTMSPPCGKVHMALQFKGLAYEIKNVQTPMEAKKYNPRGRVPALILDGQTVVDSSDILSVLESRFPDPPLEPDEPLARAQAKILEDWADEVLYFYGVYTRFAVDENWERLRKNVFSKLPGPMGWIVPPFARRTVLARLRGQGVGLKPPEVVRKELGDCLDAVATLLQAAPWLAGKRFSRADLAVCACLDQYRVRELTPAATDEIEKRPELVEWMSRVHELAPAAC